MNLPTPPKGSLEDLFRHHLLESEAAAVPPRFQVWEQLDNSLLLAQNEQYRRRLRVHRWAIAASLLLASLAGGGWWHSQQVAAPTLARATRLADGQPGLAAVQRGASRTAARLGALASTGRPGQVAGRRVGAGLPEATSNFSTPNPSAIDQTATLSGAATAALLTTTSPTGSGAYGSRMAGSTSPTGFAAPSAAGLLGDEVAAQSPGGVATAEAGRQPWAAPARTWRSRWASSPAAQSFGSTSTTAASREPVDNSALAALYTAMANEAALATRPASLPLLAASLPASLHEVAVAATPAPALLRRWHYGASYAASAFQPNIDFTKAASSYSAALGVNSASITRTAAAEYRNNLRAGLGQRLSLWAARRLGASRWSMRTGLELSQGTATSISTVAFVGEQVADLSYTQAAQAHPQRTSYRYRSASVPVELRYANPLKTGFSLYGRVGALVTALLNVRSEVDGSPEATRTYSLTSAGTPYRPLSGGVRGGAGMYFRPAGHQWALNLGPVAELGIFSLNADPSQDFMHQQRPYSFGLEAGFELGGTPKLP